jgi:hypothetical protein
MGSQTINGWAYRALAATSSIFWSVDTDIKIVIKQLFNRAWHYF